MTRDTRELPRTDALGDIRVVLVGTSHPGNIGAAARAMKTMGLERLVLVAPERFPDAEATARASGADDLLGRAEVVATLDEALAGCGLVFGASARLRSLPLPLLDPRAAAGRALEAAAATPVALVFGREDSGLANDELDRCHYLLNIPTVAGFGSLNLGAAVQVVAYELRMAALAGDRPASPRIDAQAATAEQMAGFYAHLEATLARIEFLDRDNPGPVLRKFRRLFNRVRVNRNELAMLRGVLSAADRMARLAGKHED